MKTSKNPSSHFCKFWPHLVIILLCGIFFWRVFLKGQVPFPGDFVVGIYHPWLDYKWGTVAGVPIKNPIMADVPSFMYPMQTFAFSLLKSGQWPLWNPYILGGAPLLANFQSAPFSPLSLFFTFPFPIAWTAQIIIAHILAVFFTYILLRQWKRSQSASILGGIIFSFSGFNLIWSQWNGHVLTAACFPLIIYFLDKYLTKGSIKNCVGLSFALALQIIAGYPQLILYTALVILIVFLSKFSLKKGLLIAIFTILGFALAAVQFLPGRELLSLSQWMAEPHPKAWAFLPIEKTITFFAPDYFGNHVTKNYWGPQDYTSNTGFVGVAAAVIAIIGAISFWRKRGVRIAFFIATAGLVLSYATPLSEFLWTQNIFGLRSSSAHRALTLFNLGIALLAGFGFDYLKNGKIFFKKLIAPLILVGSILFLFGLFAVITNNVVAQRNSIFPMLVFAIICITFFLIRQFAKARRVFEILFCAILICELFRFGWKFTPFSIADYIFPDTPVTEFLKKQQKPFRISNGDTMPVNFQMSYGLETLGGYETMRPAYSSQFIATLNNNNPKANPSGRYGIIDKDTSHLLDLANTKYYLTLKRNEKGEPDPNGSIPKKYDKKRFKVAFEDKTTAILESTTVLPRAFMVYDWETSPSDTQTLEQLLDPLFPMANKVLLIQSPKITAMKSGTSDTKIVNYESQKVVVRVTTDNDGLLFISDAWYPGWQAFVDGKETNIFRANYMFRALEVPQGTHSVEFIYKPKSFYNGLQISIFSFVALLLILAYTNLKRI